LHEEKNEKNVSYWGCMHSSGYIIHNSMATKKPELVFHLQVFASYTANIWIHKIGQPRGP
jgi:hypothetical protein